MFPEVKSKLFLAPMAGYTDPAFRELSVQYGAGMVFTELISADAILHNSHKTLHMMQVNRKQRPCGIQLFGSIPEKLAKAASIVEKDFDVVDLNVGCPAPKVTRAGFGSDLLTDPQLIAKIIKAMAKSCSVPITLKIRAGITDTSVNAVEIAKLAQEGGAGAITIHARTQKQGFSGPADWSIIKEVKRAVSIPVIGNGGIDTPEDALELLAQTGCDYMMVGRAALGNPYFFKQYTDVMNTGSYAAYDEALKKECFGQYLSLALDYAIPFADVREQAMKFFSGYPGSKDQRVRVAACSTFDQLLKISPKIFNSNNQLIYSGLSVNN